MTFYCRKIEILLSLFDEITLDTFYPGWKRILQKIHESKKIVKSKKEGNQIYISEKELLTLINQLKTFFEDILTSLPKLKFYEDNIKNIKLTEKEKKIYYYKLVILVLSIALVFMLSFKLAGYFVKIIT